MHTFIVVLVYGIWSVSLLVVLQTLNHTSALPATYALRTLALAFQSLRLGQLYGK